MNFLAHQYLSFELPVLMVGNFIADTIRGSDLDRFPEGIRTGIELHRFIDVFTDAHPITLESRKLLYADFGKYAQVVQDIFYDHFLARHWDMYHGEALAIFAEKVYTTLEAHQAYFNERAARTLYYMKLHNWLVGYASEEGIDRALKGMARRASFPSGMQESLPALRMHYTALGEHFRTFMPALTLAVNAEFAEKAALLAKN